MSYTLSRPNPIQRSGLLTLVIGLHVGAFILLFAARTVLPKIMETPMIVDLLQVPEAPQTPTPKPVMMPRPAPVKPSPMPVVRPAHTAKSVTALVDSTNNSTPAPAATTATPAEARPETAAPTSPAIETVTQARYDADYLKNPAPAYPPISRRTGENGIVILRVSVTQQGTADSVAVKTSSGSQNLDEAAQKAVRRWKFIPAKRGDSAIQSWVLVPIIFKLEH